MQPQSKEGFTLLYDLPKFWQAKAGNREWVGAIRESPVLGIREVEKGKSQQNLKIQNL